MTKTDHRGITAPARPALAQTVGDLAAALQVSVRTVRRIIVAGEVRVIRFGRSAVYLPMRPPGSSAANETERYKQSRHGVSPATERLREHMPI
jgi:hypothetical protein